MKPFLQILVLSFIAFCLFIALWFLLDSIGKAEAQETAIADPIPYNGICVDEIETALAREQSGTASSFEQFDNYVNCLNQLVADLKPNGKVRPKNVVLDKGQITAQDLIKWHIVASAQGKPVKDSFVDRETERGKIRILEVKTLDQVKKWESQ